MSLTENQYKTINNNSSYESNSTTKTSLNTADFDNNPDLDIARRLVSNRWECFKEPLNKDVDCFISLYSEYEELICKTEGRTT